MNQLPQFLQREIWEYVHGDQRFWAQKFSAVVNEFFPAMCDEHPRKMLNFIQGLKFDRRHGLCPVITRCSIIHVNHKRFMFFGNRSTYTIIGPHHNDKIHFRNIEDAQSELLSRMRNYHRLKSSGVDLSQFDWV